MSDLAATNCGCNDGGNSCSSIIWIIILLSLCGGCGNNGSGFNFSNNGCGGNDGCGCLWIILLLLFCGGGCGGNGIF